LNNEMSRVLAILKENPRGLTVTGVSKAMAMNRNSVAKYLEMLVITGRVDMKAFGPSKLYCLSQRVPIAAMLGMTSDYVVALNHDFSILFANDRFLELVGSKREDVIGHNIATRSVPVLSHPDFITCIREALQGKEMTREICIQKPAGEFYFNVKLIPAVLEDGAQGLTIIFEDITVRKLAERSLHEAKEELERRVERRTADLRLANEALQAEIRDRRRHEELSEALNDINLTINSTLDFEEVMKRVVTVSAGTLQCETAIIALREIDGWVARYTFGIPVDIRGTRQPDEYVPRFEYTGGCWLPVAMEDVLTDPRANRQVCEKIGIRSVLVIPLALKAKVIGAMFLNYHATQKKFSQEEVDFSRKLGASVTLALENARSFEKVTRMERMLNATVAWYVETVEKSPIFALMLDREGRVQYANAHLLTTMGLENADIRGKDWYAIFVAPGDRSRARAEFELILRKDEPGGSGRIVYTIEGKTGQGKKVEWYNALIRSPEGKQIGMASIGSQPAI
jgi:PAS domain S-box-containing protein